ncbi:MAG TPA: GAF domain-containing sensor histidine kinase [Nitrospira sp.]|nr:GAF domain-containing sensor histidine kinase [Nitrospira sp.]
MTISRSTDFPTLSETSGMGDGSLARLLARRELELAAAQRMSEVFSQQIKLEEIMAQALRIALDVVEAENGSILLADPDTQTLVFYHSIGDKPVTAGTTIPWDEGIAGTVFRTGQPEIVPDAQTDRRHFRKVDEATGSVTHDMITIPLRQWEGAPIGVLQVMNKRGDAFLNKDDLAILTIISALAAVAIEHTRLVEAAKLAEVAQRMGDITHDIKNLLMPVVCGAGILQTEINDLLSHLPEIHISRAKASRELCNEIIQMLKEDARRIQDRVREIADAVKGLSSPLEFSACEVSSVVSNVFRSLGVLAQERSVTLATENLDLLPLIVVDSRRLYNAIYNLINNAIPEVPPGGSVTVRGKTLPDEGTIDISVIDTGRGMPPEVRDRLFTKGTISTKPGGTGLGTKVVKDVVDAHGGKVWVESELGQGTKIHIRLPLSPAGIPHLEQQKIRL